MKTHTTNYINTFIEIAIDSPTQIGQIPPIKDGKKTIANHQFDILYEDPYTFTSDDVLFETFAVRKDIPENEKKEARNLFFSKGQPCFRSSPLTKRYGWGIHFDKNEKIAIYAAGSIQYEKFIKDESIKKVKAMASKRV